MVAGTGVAGSVDGLCSVASFNKPCSVAYDPKSNITYVSDRGNNRIRKITPDGEIYFNHDSCVNKN